SVLLASLARVRHLRASNPRRARWVATRSILSRTPAPGRDPTVQTDSQFGRCGLLSNQAAQAPPGTPPGGPVFLGRPRHTLSAFRSPAPDRAAARAPRAAKQPRRRAA